MRLVSLNLLPKLLRRFVGIGLCWALLIGLVATLGNAAELQIDFSFNRQSKVGCWTPVKIEAPQVEAAACEIVAIDPDGVQVVYPLSRSKTPPGATAWTGTFRCGRLDSNPIIRLKDQDGRVVREERLAKPTDGSNELPFLRQAVNRWLEIGFNTPLLETVPQVEVTQ